MRILLLFIASFVGSNCFSQVFYMASDPITNGWTAVDATHVFSSNANPSSGYNATASSPGASGGNNVSFEDCRDKDLTFSLTSPVISTVGKTKIRIGFGRINSGFGQNLLLEWFDGSQWNSLGSISGSGSWTSVFYDLPSPGIADNNNALRFRFKWVQGNNGTCNGGKIFSIDDFWVGGNYILPIQLHSFTIQPLANPVINWATLAESDNSHFILERSREGEDFIKINTIQGKGTTDAKNEYAYTDVTPYKGTNYYRLKQVDYDGTMTSFGIKSAYVTVDQIEVYPTLMQDLILIEMPKTNRPIQWSISNSLGQQSLKGILAPGIENDAVNVQQLAPGTYFLSLQTQYGQEVFKLIKF